MLIKFIANDIEVKAELKDTKTAREIYKSLPLISKVNTWGEEIYFSIPVEVNLEKNARDVLKIGDVCYWPNGRAIAIFFGKTPASYNNEPRAADLVNVFGRILDNIEELNKIKDGDEIKIEKVK